MPSHLDILHAFAYAFLSASAFWEEGMNEIWFLRNEMKKKKLKAYRKDKNLPNFCTLLSKMGNYRWDQTPSSNYS